MPRCRVAEVYNGTVHFIDCPVCSDIECTDQGDFLPCGCLVKEIHSPIVEGTKDLGLEFISRCFSHSPKADSRKADPGTEYAFTLTMPPDYTPKKTILDSARLIMENGLTSGKPYEKASKWAIVLEHTEKGVPHIHGVYQTPSGRRIEQKYFKRYWDLWDEKTKLGHGHKGGYHAKARHSESYAAYLEKEGVVIKGMN